MSDYLGDFAAATVVRYAFNSHKADGTPITLAGTPAVSVYKDASTTESTTGVTLSVDFDSRTGMHLVAIDTSADGTFYATGSDFRAVLTAGTVDGISVVGTVLCLFSLRNRGKMPATLGSTDYSGNTVQTGDAYARIGAAGAGLTALGDTRLAHLDVDISSRMATFSYTTPPSSATVSAAVWDLATSGHTTSGTFGAAMNAAGSAGDPLATTVPGAYGAGTAGFLIGTYLNAAVSTRSTYAGGDTAGTTTLLSRIGGSITISGGKVAATMGASDYSGNTVQTGDSYGRIGALGAGLTALAPSSTALSTAQWTNVRAAYLDNISGAQATPAAVATAVWTTTTSSDFTVGGSPGNAMKVFRGLLFPGNVSVFTDLETTGFSVTLLDALPSGTVAASFVGLWLEFTTGANVPGLQQIESATITSPTNLTLTFANGFNAIPENGDTFVISS